jgi:hypothetical protein
MEVRPHGEGRPKQEVSRCAGSPLRWRCCLGSAVVGSAARHDGRHDNQAGVLVETDERSPVADTQAPLVSSAFEAPHVSGGQSPDRCEDALLFVARELAQGLRRSGRDRRVPQGQLRRQVPAPRAARLP